MKTVRLIDSIAACGHNSYDDFLELSPGGLEKMANELQSSGYIKSVSIGTRTGGVIQRIWSFVSTLRHSVRSLVPHTRSRSNLPIAGPQTAVVGDHLHQSGPGCKFLHICVEKGHYSTRMHHIDVCEKRTDRVLFSTLRRHYKETRRELNGILFKVRIIDFVEVKAHL
jgi:hypothetical protein